MTNGLLIVMSTEPIAPVAVKRTPEEKLVSNLRLACLRISRGKAARANPSIWIHNALEVLSVVASSVGSAGVVIDKSLPSPDNGWRFWVSFAFLLFGVTAQIASRFQVEQRASNSRALAEKCDVEYSWLEFLAHNEDPQSSVVEIVERLQLLLNTSVYLRVLPAETVGIEREGNVMADKIISTSRANWNLKARKQKGFRRPSDAQAPREGGG